MEAEDRRKTGGGFAGLQLLCTILNTNRRIKQEQAYIGNTCYDHYDSQKSVVIVEWIA